LLHSKPKFGKQFQIALGSFAGEFWNKPLGHSSILSVLNT
jgi:hypothetical protein